MILVISPHTDDGELGCGGSMARYAREKNETVHLVFFDREKQSGEILKEFERANDILGVPAEHRIIEGLNMRSYEKNRQKILDLMIDVEKKFKPDFVFLPSSKDFHQDHMTISKEGLRAFKFSTILGYEEPWNNLVFETSCFIQILEEDLLRKLQALNCYGSQRGHYYFSEEVSRALALIRGTQIKAKYAEAFEVIRVIIR